MRSVTFSNATTAAVTVTDYSQSERGAPTILHQKGSSLLLRKDRKSDIQIDTLKPKGSSSSLRSFYDKSRTPLVVSQQTSESSRRDFALRKGVPAVVSPSTQETAHSRQIRLTIEPPNESSQDTCMLTPSFTNFSNSSSRSLVPSVPETASDTVESLASQPTQSGSRISILRNRTSLLSPTPRKIEHYFQDAKPDIDPSRVKINIRRPKAGTKNWFDSLDTDSSDDEDTQREPHLTDDLTPNITDSSISGRPRKMRPVTSLPDFHELPTELPNSFRASRRNTQSRAEHAKDVPALDTIRERPEKRKRGVFDNADLAKQSILDLDSSDEEDHKDSSQTAQELSDVCRAQVPIQTYPRDVVQVDASHPKPATTERPANTLEPAQKDHVVKHEVPRRVSSRMMTYLDDCSTETVTMKEDLLTSFPQTPTTTSRSSSLRGYTASEEEGPLNTKVMTVTRQEESLIAAMRLKKTAMKRAQALADRQSALRTLELNSISNTLQPSRPAQRDSLCGVSKPQSPSTQPRVRPRAPSTEHNQRTDSVTTFQTDSIRQPSIRSSIATYLSEGSEDLQLPYSTTDGLPIGSSHPRQASSTTSDRPQSSRDTFLSELSRSTYTGSPSELSPSVRDSRVVDLDPLDRQILRGEIPSQLFMERPFLGWEAQSTMQSAH